MIPRRSSTLRAAGPIRALRRSNRGASAVTYALALPLFILLVFGTFEAWRIVSIRQSLERGVYKAARYLSQHHLRYEEARGLLYAEVADNAWLMTTSPDDLELLTVPADLRLLQPGDKLVVEARLPVHVGDLGFFALSERGSPAWITLKAQCTTFVDFTSDEWEPLDEGTAY